jgi:hypothetical protein
VANCQIRTAINPHPLRRNVLHKKGNVVEVKMNTTPKRLPTPLAPLVLKARLQRKRSNVLLTRITMKMPKRLKEATALMLMKLLKSYMN